MGRYRLSCSIWRELPLSLRWPVGSQLRQPQETEECGVDFRRHRSILGAQTLEKLEETRCENISSCAHTVRCCWSGARSVLTRYRRSRLSFRMGSERQRRGIHFWAGQRILWFAHHEARRPVQSAAAGRESL